MNKNLIYDVGMHLGEDTEYYLKKGFQVVAIEANPELVQAARKKFSKSISNGRLVIVECAIAEVSGPVSFFLDTNSVWGTTLPEWSARNQALGSSSKKITVQGEPFSKILVQHGIPYFMKIDIEGADLLCLKALRDFSVRPRFISIESEKRSFARLRKEFGLLTELGYHDFKIVEQGVAVTSQKLPNPAREGITLEHRFAECSSGAFGEEAPGNWVTESQALSLYRKIFLRYILTGDFGILRKSKLLNKIWHRIPFMHRFVFFTPWYDTHAKRSAG